MLSSRFIGTIRAAAWRIEQRARRWLGMAPRLRVHRLDALSAYLALSQRRDLADGPEAALVAAHPAGTFSYPGYCWVDARPADFRVDYDYAASTPQGLIPNWRERLVCPHCGLNNRQRAALQLAGETLRIAPAARVYITEQLSAVHAALGTRYPALIGSEFLGAGVAPGSVDARGIRHEDLTGLSLADGSVDAVLSFDVLEHIPDVGRALSECARVLAPGGVLLLSVPFIEDSETTRVRAELTRDGKLVHHFTPQYHGDPVHPEAGVLCYHEFGWDLLGQLRQAGFARACALAYRSNELGYLGGWPIVFAAWKGRGEPDLA